MKRGIFIVFIFLFIIACLGAAGYSVYYFFFMPNNKVVPAFDEQKLNLVIEGDLIVSKSDPKIVDEQILLPIEVIKEHIDPNIYWDAALGKVTVTTEDRVIRMKTDSLDALVNNEPMTLNIPVTEENGEVFIPIEFLSDFYNIEISYLKEQNVIIIDFKNSLRQIAEPIDANAVVRKGRSIHFPIVRKFDLEADDDNTMRVFDEYDKWYKVRLSDGTLGYIEKKYVVVKRMMVNMVPQEKEEKDDVWKPSGGKINLVWEQTYSKIDLSKLEKMEGIDVVSPTWFQIVDAEGKVNNRADPGYVEWAHRNGYKVWALLASNFSDSSVSKKILNNTDLRDNVIRQILAYAALYKLDGINLDFENIDAEDKNALTQFVREITPFLREQGLVVSIDINLFPCYDRKALAETVDYVMLMAYDQHWKGGSEAGSVAQVAWVEKILKEFLETVPREKFLLGMPYYTRLWKEEPGEDGKIELSSEALSMEKAKKVVLDNNAQVVWDDTSGQFYSEFEKDGTTYKVWLEDENSINLRAALVQKYRLAGAAGWSRNFAVPEIWDVLNTDLKLIENYNEWKEQNNEKKYAFNN